MPIGFTNGANVPIPEVPGIQITETNGARRTLRLRGRALPGQSFPSGRSQRTKLTWYPGSSVATSQLLGPELGPTKISGTWSDRFLIGQVDQQGFGELNTAEALVAAFEDICISGSDLRVQWGPVTRFGILKTFDPDWIRVQDCRWEAEFEWHGAEAGNPRAQATARTSTAALRRALVALDDEFVQDPPTVLPSYQSDVSAILDGARNGVADLFGAVKDVQARLTYPISVVRAAASLADSVRTQAGDLVANLSNTVYTAKTTLDTVVNVLDIESWSRTTALRAKQEVKAALAISDDLAKRAEPGTVLVVVVAQDTTLRQLSTRYYGDPDAWQSIADVNGLVGSVVPAGTAIAITPKPSASVSVMP